MTDAIISTLIVTGSSLYREGLLILFSAFDRVNVLNATDLNNALQLTLDHKPAVILVDSDLPENQSLKIIRKIKTQFPHIRCVVLTRTEQQRLTSLNAGADATLPKGLTTADLYKEIQPFLPPGTVRDLNHDINTAAR